MKLRFTGENPPLEYLEQFPNWSNAYDEEGDDDQDETTLKPHEQQNFIDDHVSFTTADLKTANGAKYVALLEVIAGVPCALDVYDNESWILQNRNYPIDQWRSLREPWLPEDLKTKEILFDDTSIFPLQVRSRLPRTNGENIHFQIEMNGFSTRA